MRRTAGSCLPALCAGLLAGCIASNVVATEDRAVLRPVAELPFVAAPELVLDGLYESIEITGDAALALRRIYYLFRPDGTYTAAALTEGERGAAFQTLSGTWTNTAAGLSLDGADPVRLERADEHLRITAANGAVVLRRSAAP
ncbi:MAG: hypothetical protein JNM25_16435 [Planctomycetes bacterium]|nr:hypothetical protein [Planctomycetota bacterium]